MPGKRKRRSVKELREQAAAKAREQEEADKRASQRTYVMQMMSAGRWIPGISQINLAAQWEVPEKLVEQRAKEAGRALRALCKLDEEFKAQARAECIQTFRTIRAYALGRASAPDETRQESIEDGVRTVRIERHERNVAQLLDVALRATSAFGRYTGVEPLSRRIDAESDAHPIDTWSREECIEFLERRKTKRALPESVGVFETIGEDADGGPVH